jgi:ABC-2 type transport system permease protein
MPKLFYIAKREFLETIRSKIFLISFFLAPLILIFIIYITSAAEQNLLQSSRSRTLAVIDLTGKLTHDVEALFSDYNKSQPKRTIELRLYSAEKNDHHKLIEKISSDIRSGRFDALLVISPDILADGKSYFYMNAKNISNLDLYQTVSYLIDEMMQAKRLAKHKLPPQLLQQLKQKVQIDYVDVTSPDQQQKQEISTVIMTPFFFLFLMFLGCFSMNQQMLTSVIEEKSSRIMELLLSAVSPMELMAGKILGLSAVGFLLIASWGVSMFFTAQYRNMGELVTPDMVGYFVIYYILGFLLFSSMFAAIGSAFNSVREAQALITPISLIFVIPLIGWFWFAHNPQSPATILLSYFPPLTPMMMILRISAFPYISPIEIFLSILLLCASVPAVIWVSAKIFRTGVLMYGKPPTLREIFHWITYK